MKWIGTQTIYDSVRFKKPLDIAADVTFYQPVNDANPAISLGSSAADRFEIQANYNSGAQTLDAVELKTYTTSGTANDGRIQFIIDEVATANFNDDGLFLNASKGLTIGSGNAIISDSSGTTTLSNIDALDATTIATFETAMEANLDTFGSQMTSASALATVGTIGTGVWQGDVIASEYLDADTAHLTTNQTFTGVKTFANGIILDGDRSVTPRDGTAIHVDGATITDTATSASGTAAINNTITIESQTLAATNASVTNTNAASLYIAGPPLAGTNMTLTNAYPLQVGSGLVKFGGALTVGGTITGDVTGDLTGEAATVATIAGLAPNTATTQATQPNIESIGTDGDTLNLLADNVVLSNTTASKPLFQLYNKTDDAFGPRIDLWNQRINSGVQDGEDDDVLGTINFQGYDDQPAIQTYASIISTIHDATSGEESGSLYLQVANHDGGLGSGLILTGGSENDEVDVTLGLGANSVVTIPGAIQPATVIASAYLDADTAHLSGAQTFTGTKTLNSFKGTAGATVTNILDEDAMGSNSATALATQQSIKAYVDVNKITHYQVQGYATGGTGGDYVISKNIGSNLAPFLHNVSTGSDGLDAKSVAVWLRTGGHVMPNNCTLTRFTGWTASQGSASQTIALFRVRLADDSDTDPSAVLLQEITYTASGNQTADLFNETAASGSRDAALLDMEAGDIIFPAIKGAGNPIYFNGTFEVIPR